MCFKKDFSHEPSIISEPYQHLTKIWFLFFCLFLPSKARDVRKWTGNKLNAFRTSEIYTCFHFALTGEILLHMKNKQITWF